jgi:hypothetical protein
VKGICDLHGGRLEIESELGVGTTIVMTIPDQRQRGAQPAPAASGSYASFFETLKAK